MNKTVTVNIGGLVFHIEEQAYEKLQRYLEAIRGHFTQSDGRDEIIQDIESRIAEIFTERIGTNRQVVTEADVNFVMDTLGRPEQVAGDDESEPQTAIPAGIITKKLYRDPDDRVLAGVCSGLGHYFGIEPVWVRLIVAISFFVWGTGGLLYLLLILIIPKAKTTSEKLEMKGKPVNIESIKGSIQEEVEELKRRVNKQSGNQSLGSTGKDYLSSFFGAMGQLIVGLVKVIGKIFAILFMLVIISLLIGLFIFTLAASGVIGDSNLPVYLSEMIMEKWQLNLSIVGIILVAGVPLFMLLLGIVRNLFKIKSDSRIINYTALGLWIAGLLISIYLISDISSDFSTKEQQRSFVTIQNPAGDTLVLENLEADALRDDSYYDDVLRIDNGIVRAGEGDTLLINRVELDIIKADGADFELVKIAYGRGSNRKEAEANTRSIQYDIEQSDSLLSFSENFTLPRDVRFRAQKLQLVLKVPVGKSVYLSKGMEEIIYDIQNITNTWDPDMIGHTWTMTEKGLECIGCNLPDQRGSDNDNVRIRIDGENVNIEDAKDDTINWENKDVKIRIRSNGVDIDAKEKK